MWLITDKWCTSAVEDPLNPDILVVRSRVRDDLVRLKEVTREGRIEAFAGTDYEYRMRIKRAVYAQAAAAAVIDIDYGNFKDAIKARQGGERASVYMGVWHVLTRLNPSGWSEYERKRRAQPKTKGSPRYKRSQAKRGKRGGKRKQEGLPGV